MCQVEQNSEMGYFINRQIFLPRHDKITVVMEMKEKIKHILLAIALGVLLPGILFTWTDKRQKPQVQQDTPLPTTVQEQTVPNQTQPVEMSIKVLLPDGKIAEMDMNSYITGVVLGEMPVSFAPEALKAQAVVARTYALRRYTVGKKHSGGAVCTNPSCCQAYCSEIDYLAKGGSVADMDKIASLVDSTDKQVLTYQGELIEATYFSCSGGRTEDALAVWGTDVPYLQAVDSPGEEKATGYADTIRFSTGEFAAMLGINPSGSAASWLGQVSYTDGGGVDTMRIAGNLYKGTVLRQKLGLPSTVFSIMAVGDTVLVSTKGFGHRVGMSQYGAEAMAVGGSNYEKILSHYYPGTTLQTYLEN